MNQTIDARMHQLVQISIDLHHQMAEVHRLRNALRLVESDKRGRISTDAGVVKGNELHA